MRHEHSIREVIHIAHTRLQSDYEKLIGSSTTFSLESFFDPVPGYLKKLCLSFQPNSEIDQVTKWAEKWGTDYGIWLPSAKYYISCAIFLYPTATVGRLLAMVKNLAIGYYLNDVAGRDVFKNLSKSQQKLFSGTIRRMSKPYVSLGRVLHNVELANIEMLTSIRHLSEKEWFEGFLHSFTHYIAVTHKDCNAVSLGYVPTVDEYIGMRYHTSGMPHIIQFVEFSRNDYLDWRWLELEGLKGKMKRLHQVAALIGALMNDLFSFEKEVIENKSDSNLVMIVAINNSGFSLSESIKKAAEMVRDLLAEFDTAMKELIKEAKKLSEEKAILLNGHLGGIKNIVQASWIWQVHTMRYKGRYTIWKETHIPSQVTARAV